MDYRHIGLMLDCSRNAVMKKQAIFQMIDVMQKIGYNTLELYTEDTYEVKDEPYFGYLRGRYSAEEIREIDAYAKARGIELIPCIQTLAHFTNSAALPAFSDLWDTADILLVGQERTYEFLDHLFASVAAMFSSRNINIGMDEAHFVGLGKYLGLHGYRNRFDILTEHLTRVAAIAEKYGFQVHLWSDMFFRLINDGEYYGKGLVVPEEVRKKLPKNAELCFWAYNLLTKNDYDEMLKSHKDFGKDVWFAGGVWSWCSYAPFNGLTQLYMKPAMQSVRENGVKDVIFTMWGDNGKDCSFFSLLPSIYAVKQYAEGIYDDETIKRGFEKTFGLNFDDFMLLDLPNRVPSNMSGDWLINPCKALLANDCLMGVYDDALKKEGHIDFAGYAEKLAAAAPKMKEYGYLFETLRLLCEAIDVKAELGLKVREAYRAKDSARLLALTADFDTAIERIGKFHKAFRAQWLRENKAFGLEVQEARLGGVMLRLQSAKERIVDYIEGRSEKIEELEEEILKYSDEGLWCYIFDNGASTSRM